MSAEWPFGDLQMFGYGVIYCDPPWQIAMWSEKGRDRCPDGKLSRNQSRQNNPERHYKTLPLEQTKALPVNHLAAPDCVLLMWVIDPMIPHALEVGKAWGFEYKTVGFYWAKMRKETSKRAKDMTSADHKMFPMGTGYWTRANPEQCLLFTRGKPKRLSASVRKLVVSPRREHSRKPDRLHDDIEKLCAGPYCELFGRRQRPGWNVWGNETTKFSQQEEKPCLPENP
jgi:N6-adenosine-specific RNA methylase IME4